jgi:hypothetical protein
VNIENSGGAVAFCGFGVVIPAVGTSVTEVVVGVEESGVDDSGADDSGATIARELM